MKVPLLDLSVQNGPLKEKIFQAIERVYQSQAFILGPEVENFEKRVASYSGAAHGIGVSSGTDALLVALMALGVKDGDEVITTPYSFFATAGAIARVGARPVFVDIDPKTFNIDPKRVEKAITKKTKAIMPVHLYGQCADMAPLVEIARRKSLPVVEDAAQAIGAQYKDKRKAGAIGDIGCFSFFPSKNLGAWGDGGMVVCSDGELAKKIRILRVHGSEPKYYHKWIGGNFRIDALQAAILNVKLDSLDAWTAGRQKNARRYNQLFQQSELVSKAHVQLPAAIYESLEIKHFHIYNQYVIRAQRRDELISHLKKKEIGVEVYYPVPLHLQECFGYLGHKAGDFPEAERAAKETLALPIYSELSENQQDLVVQAIKDFYA